MAAQSGYEAKQALRGGVTAGVIAGAVLAICMAIGCVLQGFDIWSNVFKGAATPFIGDAAREPGFALGPVLLGAACHFAVSILWGVSFALLVYGLSRPVTMMAAIVWGLVVWAAMFTIVLPLVGLAEMARNAPLATGLIYHEIFGLTVGLAFLPFQHPHHVHVHVHRETPVPGH